MIEDWNFFEMNAGLLNCTKRYRKEKKSNFKLKMITDIDKKNVNSSEAIDVFVK